MASTAAVEKDSKSGITEERSKQICQHMNDDHKVSVYAMAISSFPYSKRRSLNLQNVQMTSVSLEKYTITFVVCDGDLCSEKNVSVPFSPVLKSSTEIRSRIVEEHHKYLTPSINMILQDGLSLAVAITMTALGYGAIAVGTIRMEAYFQDYTLIDTLFGSSFNFSKAVYYSFYFGFLLHGLEAIYVFYASLKVLKLRFLSSYKWFILTFLTGYPITSQFLILVSIAKEKKKK